MSRFTSPIGSRIESANLGGMVTVVGRSWTPETAASATDAAIASGSVPADTVMLSSDGKAWCNAWHTGASEDAAYVELSRADGSGMHGWVDVTTRRLVQVG